MGKLKKSEIMAIEPKYFMKLSWYFGQRFVILEKIIETIQYEIKGEKKNIIKTLLENVIFSSILTKETKFSPVKNNPNDTKIKVAAATMICITFFLFSITPPVIKELIEISFWSSWFSFNFFFEEINDSFTNSKFFIYAIKYIHR